MRSLLSCVKVTAALALLALSGCGSGDDGRVSVSGSVTLDGAPLDGGMVAFIGGGGGSLATASTDREGKFHIRVAPGLNKVTISKEDMTAMNKVAVPEEEMLMGTDAQYKEQQKSKPKEIVPAKYSNANTSGLSFEINSGMQPLSISLTSK